jgi:hypothetical protein
MEAPTENQDDSPIKGYLITAGIPAGLLLWAGSKYILKRVGSNEVYQKEAAETLGALEWLQGIGLACALGCAFLLMWGLKKMVWRKKT